MSLQHELSLPYPFESAPHEALLNIVMTGEQLSKEADRILRPFDLTNTQFNVLMLLRYQSPRGEMSQTALGNMLVVNRSNVTGLVDRMQKAGWVVRTGDPDDRRVNLVRLTPAGRRLLERAEKAYFARIESILSTMPAAEIAEMCRRLERVRAALRGQKRAGKVSGGLGLRNRTP
ncbi:MAG: MarR family transcriptional regulator [Candidatus Sumerlaeia bacterium]|nr:MarR family transcriptional regulator [Candidatus Sumerlaeia bacterium]